MNKTLTIDDFPWMAETQGRWYAVEFEYDGTAMQIINSDINVTVAVNYLYLPVGYRIHNFAVDVKCNSGTLRSSMTYAFSTTTRAQGIMLSSATAGFASFGRSKLWIYASYHAEDLDEASTITEG